MHTILLQNGILCNTFVLKHKEGGSKKQTPLLKKSLSLIVQTSLVLTTEMNSGNSKVKLLVRSHWSKKIIHCKRMAGT